MSGINSMRVLAGGLVAGLIINVSEFILNTYVVAADMAETTAKYHLPPMDGRVIGIFVLLGFLIGIAMIWLYAAVRPRFGPGPKTAFLAACTVWFLAYFWGHAGMAAMGLIPAASVATGLAWGFVEVVIAAQAGAYLYRE